MSKQSAYFRVPVSGKHEKEELKKSIEGISGVIDVSVNETSNKVAVDYDSTGTSSDSIKSEIESAGFRAQLLKNEDHIM